MTDCKWCTKDRTCTHHQLVDIIQEVLDNSITFDGEDIANAIEYTFRVEEV